MAVVAVGVGVSGFIAKGVGVVASSPSSICAGSRGSAMRFSKYLTASMQNWQGSPVGYLWCVHEMKRWSVWQEEDNVGRCGSRVGI